MGHRAIVLSHPFAKNAKGWGTEFRAEMRDLKESG
jgi:hypothetical protein